MKNLPLLRSQISPPKAAGEALLKTRSERLALHDLQDRIWREFLSRLSEPVKVHQSKKHRTVEVLGCVRYCINTGNGRIQSEIRCRPGKGDSAFSDPSVLFLVDLPLRLNAYIVSAFISEWDDEIAQVALGDDLQANPLTKYEATRRSWVQEQIRDAFVQSFLKAIRQTVYWKRLRYLVKDAIGIDPELLAIARLSRLNRHSDDLCQEFYHEILEYEARFRQLYREAPNLIWLLAIIIRARIDVEGETLQFLKTFLKGSVGQRGWRLIAKSAFRDFAPIIENMNYPLKGLESYVRLHNTLDRNQPIPRKAQHLFAEPLWRVDPIAGISYRGIAIQPTVLNSYIDAVVAAPDLEAFLAGEATRFFTWLSEAKPELDSNQCKQGWPWLSRQAELWAEEVSRRNEFESISWDTRFGETTISGYRFVPLKNAWEVILEAVRYRHCADRFIDECQAGIYRLFSVYGSDGTHKATLGTVCTDDGWIVDQVRGFANRPVSNALLKICRSLADGLDLVGEGENARAEFEVLAGLPRPADLEGEPDGDTCPVCNDPDTCCSHLLASFDHYVEGLCGGVAHDAIKGWYEVVSSILRICIERHFSKTGLGDDFDDILAELLENHAHPGRIDHGTSLEEYRKGIEAALCQLIGGEEQVKSNIHLFNGSAFQNYWAEDTKKAISSVDEFLRNSLEKVECLPVTHEGHNRIRPNKRKDAEGGLHP